MTEARLGAILCVVANPAIDKTAEVERLEPGRIHRPATTVAFPGGKGLNVARAARHLGMRVEAILLLAGHAGRWLDGEAEQIGLDRRVVWIDGETRTCLSVLDRSTGRLTEFYEPGPQVPSVAWARFVGEVEASVRAHPPGTLVAISGSFPPGVTPDAARRLVAITQRSGGRVLLDTSGAHLHRALVARPYLVKVNEAEAEAVYARPIRNEADALQAARELVRRGAERAVLTRGARGAVATDAARGWAVDPPAAGGPYVVGAGDAFLAGVAAALTVELPFEDALRWGAAAATASTQLIGQGELRRTAAERLRRRVRVRKLAGAEGFEPSIS